MREAMWSTAPVTAHPPYEKPSKDDALEVFVEDVVHDVVDVGGQADARAGEVSSFADARQRR